MSMLHCCGDVCSFFPTRWRWLTQEAEQAGLLLSFLREKRQAGLSCLLTVFCLSTLSLLCSSWVCLHLSSPWPSLSMRLTELLIIRRWALKHLNSQVAGWRPGRPGQPNEASALNNSSNPLCRGSMGWQGQSRDQLANRSTGQGASRSQKVPV